MTEKLKNIFIYEKAARDVLELVRCGPRARARRPRGGEACGVLTHAPREEVCFPGGFDPH
jgi:hypothetical protein